MISLARKQQILNEIASKGFVSTTELAAKLVISLSTIRRDLIELEQDGAIVRTRGGAVSSVNGLVLDTAPNTRATQHRSEKIKIAQKAADMISDAGCIILDAGTTTLEVARCLFPQQPLKVITDSIEIAYELRDRENVTVIVTGGILRSGSYNLYGNFGQEIFLESLNAQTCVFGTIGLSLRDGLTKHDIDALSLRKKMIEISHQLICVADSSKFKATGLVSICPVDKINILITDAGIDPNFQQALESFGMEIIIA